jgi:hypothetical protein
MHTISDGVGGAVENQTPITSPDPGLEQGPIARWVIVDIVVVLCASYDYPLKTIMIIKDFQRSLLFLLLDSLVWRTASFVVAALDL